MNDILLAALLEAQADGDGPTVARLRALADAPDELAALLGRLQADDEPATFAALYHGPAAPAPGWTQVGTGPRGGKIWAPPARKAGLVGRLLGKKDYVPPTSGEETTAADLQKSMDASPEYQKQRAEVERRNGYHYEQLAQQSGKSVDEVKAGIANRAQALVDSQEVYVRVKATTLPMVLRSGRFKTVHETKTSDALADPKMRKLVEAKGMGVGPDEPAETRPVSVYLGGPDFSTVGQERGANAYGVGPNGEPPVIIKLKPAVRDRATVTFGDSLEQLGNGYAVASPLGRVDALSVDPRELQRNPQLLDDHAGYHTTKGFIEAQIHGGVSTADIEEIGFAAEPPADVKQALESNGIKWRVYKAGDL